MKTSTIVIIVLVILIIYIIIKWATDKVVQLCYKEKSGVRIAPIPGNKLGKEQGPNFSFSLWFYVTSWQNSEVEKVLLVRESEVDQTVPEPGTNPNYDFKISLGKYKNTLETSVKIMSTDSSGDVKFPTCKIDEVPLQKWVHVLVTSFGKTLDTYINGKLERTCILDNVIRVNPESSVYINPLHAHGSQVTGKPTAFKTWDGWVANGRYYPYYLNPQEVWNIYKEGYDSAGFGGVLNKYRIKFVFLVGSEEKGAFMI